MSAPIDHWELLRAGVDGKIGDASSCVAVGTLANLLRDRDPSTAAALSQLAKLTLLGEPARVSRKPRKSLRRRPRWLRTASAPANDNARDPSIIDLFATLKQRLERNV